MAPEFSERDVDQGELLIGALLPTLNSVEPLVGALLPTISKSNRRAEPERLGIAGDCPLGVEKTQRGAPTR